MNVLFLDIDGVLNHAGQIEWIDRRLRNGEIVVDYRNKELESRVIAEACPIAVSNLKFIIEEVPQLKIVVHSKWTKNRGWEFVLEFFNKLGFDTKDWETTPKKLSSEKTHEINFWLQNYEKGHNDETPKFKVVDDSSWAYRGPRSDEVMHVIDPYLGLTMRDAIKLIYFFNPEWNESVWIF